MERKNQRNQCKRNEHDSGSEDDRDDVIVHKSSHKQTGQYTVLAFRNTL